MGMPKAHIQIAARPSKLRFALRLPACRGTDRAEIESGEAPFSLTQDRVNITVSKEQL